MKSTASAIFSIFLFLNFISFSLADSQTTLNSFVKCLTDHSPSISAAIYISSNASFSSVLFSYARNLRYMTPETPKPIAIITASDETHVQATVLCTKSVKLQIRIRSGGHDYDGLSYVSSVPFIVLDMSNLRSIDINITEETAWVDAGATLGELYYRIAEKSPVHGFPAGVCTTLGVGGHFTGGGYGNMMRKYGLSVDNIIDAKVVDVKGRVLNRASMGENLFWAIRGGGAASFCVVLAWKVKLVRVPETVTVFRIDKTLQENETDLVFKWQLVADKFDNDLFIRLMLGSGKQNVQAAFIALFLGKSDRLLRLMNEDFPELGLQKKDCNEMKWVESVLFWINNPNVSETNVLLERIPKSENFLKRKSDYVQTPIPKSGLESIWKAMIEIGNVVMNWNPYGGKMGEILATETAFPHRAGNIFKIQYGSNWNTPGKEIADELLSAPRKLYEAMTPYVSSNPRESFLNYRDVDIGVNLNASSEQGQVYGRKYFKDNFHRLVEVKTLVDPQNFFNYEQSIPIKGTNYGV